MDFFQAQDHARRSTRLLIVYFLLSVAAIIAAVYLVSVGVLGMGGEPGTPTSLWQADLFILISLGLLTLILGGTAYKSIALSRGGGRAVAEMLGGRQVQRSTGDPAEQRLLNVVDEMAIASGVPVPAVYVLDEEPAINAFAAGVQTDKAVIAVTRGTLEQLSRDELQGVVAHEFSHVLNGDMRLNIRLIGVLHGLLLLTLLGRILMHSSGRSRNAGGAVMAGLALVVLGYLGVLFGALIKAAVSRQREYLADAAAVQFTRNPAGIAGALKKIGGFGSQVRDPHAEEVSHMFFGQGAGGLSEMFATHPPIEVRIRRLDPSFNPDLAERVGAPGAAADTPVGASGFAGAASPVDAGRLAATVGTVREPHVARARELIARLPRKLLDDIHQPAQAKSVIYALLIEPNEPTAAAQFDLIEQSEPGAAQAARESAGQLHAAGSEVRLPVVDLALPALAEMDAQQRRRFLTLVDRLIEADGRMKLFEYTLRTILWRGLAPEPGKQSRRVGAGAIRDALSLVLSLLSRAGSANEEAAREAFSEAARRAPIEALSNIAPRAVRLADLNEALVRLDTLPPRFKRKLVEACAAAVIHDGKVTVNEAELLRATCEALGCPMPPLLPGMATQDHEPHPDPTAQTA